MTDIESSLKILFDLIEQSDEHKNVGKIGLFLNGKQAIINCVDQNGCSPLLKALTYSDELFELLLIRGADPNSKIIWSKYYTPILSQAIGQCNYKKKHFVSFEKIKLLLKYGARPNDEFTVWEDSEDLTAMYFCAVYTDNKNKENIMKLLIDYNADCSIKYNSWMLLDLLGINNGNTCFDLIKDKKIRHSIKTYYKSKQNNHSNLCLNTSRVPKPDK